MYLLIFAIAPVVIIAFYIYFRDKYEKEPFSLLFKSILAGAFITLPILGTDYLLEYLFKGIPTNATVPFRAFILAGLVEESFKFLVVYILIWKNRYFNERFDGIVYAVFVSLGFAMIENIMYTFHTGMNTALIRAVTAVPMHAIAGITMGYYFGLARFLPDRRRMLLVRALVIPVFLHGLYDYFIMTENNFLLLLWVPFFIYLWFDVFRKMKILLKADHDEIKMI